MGYLKFIFTKVIRRCFLSGTNVEFDARAFTNCCKSVLDCIEIVVSVCMNELKIWLGSRDLCEVELPTVSLVDILHLRGIKKVVVTLNFSFCIGPKRVIGTSIHGAVPLVPLND